MKRYQIRVPKSSSIEEVIEQMASKGWDSIIHSLDAERIMVPLRNYRHFQNALFQTITPRMRNYVLCRKPDFCNDAICMCKLDKRPKPTTESGDQIYQLFVGPSFETFFDEVLKKVIDAIENILKSGQKEKVMNNLQESFRSVLANYLYFNPVCGTTPFCEYVESIAVASLSLRGENRMPIWQ